MSSGPDDEMTNPNVPIDLETGLPTVRDFDELGSFLRSAGGDEESSRVSAGMRELAARVESVGKALAGQQDAVALGLQMVELLTALRMHRALIVGLSPEWRGLYEYPAYLASLNNFRVLVGQWLSRPGATEVLVVSPEDFQMIAWRTLGEGMIMIDMYEQWRRQSERESTLSGLDDAQIQRAKHWWKKLRG